MACGFPLCHQRKGMVKKGFLPPKRNLVLENTKTFDKTAYHFLVSISVSLTLNQFMSNSHPSDNFQIPNPASDTGLVVQAIIRAFIISICVF